MVSLYTFEYVFFFSFPRGSVDDQIHLSWFLSLDSVGGVCRFSKCLCHSLGGRCGGLPRHWVVSHMRDPERASCNSGRFFFFFGSDMEEERCFVEVLPDGLHGIEKKE
jgi:hypothetical protein